MRRWDRSEIQNACDWLDSTFLVLLFLKHEPLTVRWGAVALVLTLKSLQKWQKMNMGFLGFRTQLV
jgi:hypothetical protein